MNIKNLHYLDNRRNQKVGKPRSEEGKHYLHYVEVVQSWNSGKIGENE